MKRLFVLSFLLPVLASCTIENDYYGDGYYQSPSRGRVEVPYGPSYRAAPHTHYHQDNNEEITTRDTRHGHSSTEANRRNYRPRSEANTHGHESTTAEVTTHGHASTRADARVHGHNENKNTPVYSHDDDAENNVHGHD